MLIGLKPGVDFDIRADDKKLLEDMARTSGMPMNVLVSYAVGTGCNVFRAQMGREVAPSILKRKKRP